jgi:phenylalanyl-tRNA synthetase beta chain
VALFESGRVYLPVTASFGGEAGNGRFAGEREPPAFEPHRIGSLAVGSMRGPGWRDEPVPSDFFAIKGALEGLAIQLGAELAAEPVEHPFLAPGRAAWALLDGKPAGWVGEIHPLVLREWEIDGPAAGFEIDLADLIAASSVGEERFRDVTTHPAVFQDLAVVVGDDVPAAAVREAVAAGGGELLRSARVFDVYTGEQLGAGEKSLALRLEFSAADRTLTDDEVAERREAIKQALGKIGGSLRE